MIMKFRRSKGSHPHEATSGANHQSDCKSTAKKLRQYEKANGCKTYGHTPGKVRVGASIICGSCNERFRIA